MLGEPQAGQADILRLDHGIFPTKQGGTFTEDPQIDPYAEHLTTGYAQAKWVAEKLVWEAVQRGLPACVLRPVNIGYPSATGAANPNDFQVTIINIASTAASVSSVTAGACCASKAAVVGLTRCVAQEGAPHGVTCNAISPGWVATDFLKTWMARIAADEGKADGAAVDAAVVADNPQKRMIQPQEIGALAAFLCGEDALGITGQNLTVSGGSI